MSWGFGATALKYHSQNKCVVVLLVLLSQQKIPHHTNCWRAGQKCPSGTIRYFHFHLHHADAVLLIITDAHLVEYNVLYHRCSFKMVKNNIHTCVHLASCLIKVYFKLKLISKKAKLDIRASLRLSSDFFPLSTAVKHMQQHISDQLHAANAVYSSVSLCNSLTLVVRFFKMLPFKG